MNKTKFALALLASSALAFPALAQQALPQEFVQVDENGVDVTTGQFFFSLVEGSVGDDDGGVSLVRYWAGQAGWTDNWSGVAFQTTLNGQPVVYVSFGPDADTFDVTPNGYVSRKGNGATLTGSAGGYTYTDRDGTTIDYNGLEPDGGRPLAGPVCSSGGCYVPVSIAKADGRSYTLEWEYGGHFTLPNAYFRLKSVTSNANYKVTFTYASDYSGGQGGVPPDWFRRTKAEFTNLSSPPSPLPTVTYTGSSPPYQFTDIGGRTWQVNMAAQGPSGIRRPGSAADNVMITYNATTGLDSSLRWREMA